MANIDKEQATHLDSIIKTAIANSEKMRSVRHIRENVLPDKSDEYCLSLYYILYNFSQDIIHHNSQPDIFWLTDYAPAFIHDGGFSTLYESAVEKEKIERERQRLNDEKLSAEVDIVKFQKGLGIKLTKWGVAISAIAIVVSVLTTVATNKSEDEPFPIDTFSLKQQLKTLDLRIQKLEQQIHKDTIPKR